MHGLTESLNVSVAAACILQRLTGEAGRDRRRIFPRRAKTSSLRSGACELQAKRDAGSDARELARRVPDLERR